MKKRLEADLISIAHRILQLKNKSDVNQLFLETQKLYEKLSVLRFVEEQYGAVKPTIGHTQMISDVAAFYDNEAPILTTLAQDNAIDEVEPAVADVEKPAVAVVEEIDEVEEAEAEDATILIEEEPAPESILAETPIEEEPTEDEHTEVIAEEEDEAEDEEDIQLNHIKNEEVFEEEDVIIDEEETEEEVEEVEAEAEAEMTTPPAFTPNFSLSVDEDETEELPAPVAATVVPKKSEAVQISFEDLLGAHYSEPQFVKVNEVPAPQAIPVFEPVASVEQPIEKEKVAEKIEVAVEKTTPKTVSINDKFSKGIEIDLNDQIAFVKHLFGNSREDYNRVLSQLITFDNFYETKDFIDHMVKPDYNDWKGKDDYAERFMDIIEKKFL